MKRILALTLALVLLLCGCGSTAVSAPETSAPAEVPTEAVTEPAPATEETTPPTEAQVYRNPLNGEVLDEPFTGLDEESRLRAAEAIRQYRRGRTLILVTHRREDLPLLEVTAQIDL